MSVAVTVVSFTAAKFLTVIPGAFNAVAPVRPAPVTVTLTEVPRNPEGGEIPVSVTITEVPEELGRAELRLKLNRHQT